MNPALFSNLPSASHLQIGSWSARAFIASATDAALLDEIFKGSLHAASDPPRSPNATLYWLPTSDTSQGASVPADGLVLTQPTANTWCIASQALIIRVELTASPPQIFIYNQPHTLDPFARRVHVSVMFHKLLLLLGRLYLHGGAVQIRDGASAFVAEKWSGKSSICLWLGRAGATILSDDHILLHQTNDAFQVSGCEQVARVTAATEATLFPTPLSIEPSDFAGVLKKEFRVSDQFRALPYTDVPLRRLFFPHIGADWHIQPLSKQATLARLLTGTRASHRFTDGADYARHLDYFSNLVRAVESFDLQLTPDLTQLDRLVEFLNL